MANMQSRYLYINVEGATTYGQSATTAKKYGEVDDESFTPNFDIMTREDISRYGPRKTVIGMETATGDINFAMLGDTFCNTVIANIYNAAATTGPVSSCYTTLLTEDPTKSDSAASTASTGVYTGNNSFTIGVGREGREHRYLGQVLNSLTISANVGEYVMCSASFLGCGEDNSAEHALAIPADTVFHGNDAFHFEGAHVAFEGVASTSNERSKLVKSVELNFNMNRDADSATALGSNSYSRMPVPGVREITGTIEFNRVIHDNLSDTSLNDVMKEPFYKELAAGLTVVGTAADPALSVMYNGAANESLLIDIYSLQYDAPDSTISGRDRQTLKVSFTALYNEATHSMSKATLKSTLSAYPNA